jgi:hypothetical protein
MVSEGLNLIGKVGGEARVTDIIFVTAFVCHIVRGPTESQSATYNWKARDLWFLDTALTTVTKITVEPA